MMRLETDNEEAIKQFNALPRKPKALPGRVPNKWHIDLRYIPVNRPSHVLCFFQPESRFLYVQRIEDDIATGVTFFPETAKEATPQVARSIIEAFNSGMGTDSSASFGAPWAVVMEDSIFASQLEQEFKRIGVKPDRCNIFSKSLPAVRKQGQVAFDVYYNDQKKRWGYEPNVQATLVPPEAITFPLIHPEKTSNAWKMDLDLDDLTKGLNYARSFCNARPPSAADSGLDSAKLLEDVENNAALFAAKPEDVIRAEADSGSGVACLDYAMRYGINCRSNRLLSRVYLAKALICERAMTDRMKATAHTLLVEWFTSGSGREMRFRYICLASHHAQEAIILSRKYAKKGALPASPSILHFGHYSFREFMKDMPALVHIYGSIWEVLQQRSKQIADQDKKMQKKRLKSPYKYRCAAEGCVILADSKKMLQVCGGRCDADKKPSYCSKECQRADWPNHKPYCKPGAECSVIDNGSDEPASLGGISKQGGLRLPVKHADGSTTYISSSTASSRFMKEMKTTIEAESSVAPIRNNMHWEILKIGGPDSDSESDD